MGYKIFKRRANKFNNTRCTCRQGHIHASRLEGNYCDQLALLKKAGEIQDYKSQVCYNLEVNGHTICQHTPDFLVYTADGRLEAHEVKGMPTAAWHIKKKLFEALYPEVPYIVIVDERSWPWKNKGDAKWKKKEKNTKKKKSSRSPIQRSSLLG